MDVSSILESALLQHAGTYLRIVLPQPAESRVRVMVRKIWYGSLTNAAKPEERPRLLLPCTELSAVKQPRSSTGKVHAPGIFKVDGRIGDSKPVKQLRSCSISSHGQYPASKNETDVLGSNTHRHTKPSQF